LLLKSFLRIKKFKWIVLDFNILGTIGEAKTIRQKIFKWAISKVDGIITISEAEKEGMERIFPHLKGKIEFIHEATDLEHFTPQQDDQNLKPYILTVGKYGRDFDTIVEAVKGTDYDLKIATKPALTKHLEPLPVNVSSKLYGHEEMSELYKNAAIVIVAVNPKYTTDSVGTLSVGEGMAMKKAIIATDTASMRSYIDKGVNGVLVEGKNVQKMKDAVTELMENKSKRESVAEKGYEFAQHYLSLDHFGKKAALFIKSLF
jgi:glycosyltransferase involved in cell wall biosynthesis